MVERAFSAHVDNSSYPVTVSMKMLVALTDETPLFAARTARGAARRYVSDEMNMVLRKFGIVTINLTGPRDDPWRIE